MIRKFSCPWEISDILFMGSQELSKNAQHSCRFRQSGFTATCPSGKVLKCYQPVNCKLDLRFTTVSNGPPVFLRDLTALNNQSASAPRQNFRHPKTLETTHTTHSLRLSRLLSCAPRSMRITVMKMEIFQIGLGTLRDCAMAISNVLK